MVRPKRRAFAVPIKEQLWLAPAGPACVPVFTYAHPFKLQALSCGAGPQGGAQNVATGFWPDTHLLSLRAGFQPGHVPNLGVDQRCQSPIRHKCRRIARTYWITARPSRSHHHAQTGHLDELHSGVQIVSKRGFSANTIAVFAPARRDRADTSRFDRQR